MKASLSALIFHEASLLVTQVVENASEQVERTAGALMQRVKGDKPEHGEESDFFTEE